MDALETSVGHGWQKGPRDSPTVLNSVFNIAQFWDDKAKDLREQAKGPVQAAVENDTTLPNRLWKHYEAWRAMSSTFSGLSPENLRR